ncbi:MAG: IclR family transcriptional regulator [Halanaerobium sp.]
MAVDEIPKNTVQSLIRAMDILDLISSCKEGINVTEISARLKLHKSTVYRLLSTLEYKNYVKKDENKKYRIGKRVIEIGHQALNDIDLRKEMRPFLQKLGELTKETVHLGVIDDFKVFYIDKVESSHIIRMYSSIGKGGPLYCTGIGKVLLAFSGQKYIEKFIKRVKFVKYTENTIINKKDLRDQLAAIKNKGYAVDNMEHENNIRCVAAPIFDYRENLIAAVSISAPAQRMSMERTVDLSKLVIEYTQKMSKI